MLRSMRTTHGSPGGWRKVRSSACARHRSTRGRDPNTYQGLAATGGTAVVCGSVASSKVSDGAPPPLTPKLLGGRGPQQLRRWLHE